MSVPEPGASDKVVSLLNLVARVLLLPLVALWEFLTLPNNLVWDEPPDYGRPTPAFRSSFSAESRREALGPELESQHQSILGVLPLHTVLGAGLKKKPASMKIILKRFVNTAGLSWMLTYQSVLYIATVKFSGALGLDKFLRYFQTDFEKLSAWMTGREYVTAHGEHLPYSLLNIADPSLEGNYAELAIPHRNPRIERMQIAHLLAVASKLAYEHPLVIEDVVMYRWGCTLHDQQHVPAHTVPEGGYVPDVVWYVLSTHKAVVVAFRGANPFRQVDGRADVPVAMTWREGLGSMCDGFHRGLAQKSPCGRYKHIYDRIVAVLTSPGCVDKPVYLTGHSIGGALAAQFAQLLHRRSPAVSLRMAGLHNFAAPLVGDADFCRILAEHYPGKTFRYVHGSDIVCKLPTGWGYQHFALERFITSFPRLHGPVTRVCFEEDSSAEVERCRRFEDRWGLPIGLVKLLLSPFEEGWTRVGARILMLPLPGMTDHFPGDYERALREAIQLERYLDREMDPNGVPLSGTPEDLAPADVSTVPLRYRLMIAFRRALWDGHSNHSQLQGPPAASGSCPGQVGTHPTRPLPQGCLAAGGPRASGSRSGPVGMHSPHGTPLAADEPAYNWCSDAPADAGHASHEHRERADGQEPEPDDHTASQIGPDLSNSSSLSSAESSIETNPS
ncbi:hypothetical protein WJX84_008652 [Apatococcus fuscideae]|uniref:Fungal lipase-type domain-containing protein n=1 Tax=Apatococcus fuscideae TaxID=2026836 RepID=A0AAW1SRB0_9CHLO